MARLTKLNERTQNLILAGIQLGLSYEKAAQAAGICERTFYYWYEKGKKAKSGQYLRFLQSLQRVEAAAQLTLAKQVHDAAKGGQTLKEIRTTTYPDGSLETVVIERQVSPDWRAAMSILERRYSETWGRRDSLKVELDWRQELEKIGVNPDEAVTQTLNLLESLHCPSDAVRSDETPSV